MLLLVLNCGSATVKYKLFDGSKSDPEELDAGVIEVDRDHRGAVEKILYNLPHKPDIVAHRVVHGGDFYSEPVLITPHVRKKLEQLSELAPLHNPPALEGIAAAEGLNIPQVAAFDTAFHQTIPEHAYRYGLPPDVADRYKIRRYGFHGQSFHYVTRRYEMLTGASSPALVILHLGNGASITAVKDGRSVDTSMGVTPLEGLMMGTRAGDMDPAIVLRLLSKGMPLDEVDSMLWRGSGLYGIAGTNDMRELLERTDHRAKLAIDLFCYRAKKYIGAYLAALGGAEAIVFTGGIGEKSPRIRSRILEGMSWFGLHIDPERNEANGPRITTDDSRLHAYTISTNEEFFIAVQARDIVRAHQSASEEKEVHT